ncbi:MAG: sugar-binding domain-containing protein [Pyrinomonadaceae bacterium]
MSEASGNSKLMLREGWSIQSSAKVKESGDALSDKSYQPSNWYPATVPSTVVGTLVENKVYPDPFFGMNLREMPGCSYPIGANFSNLPMPEDSPYKVSWWYRTQFQIPESYRGENVWLHFDGINFRANIWLNGRQIANSKEIAGTFRLHELNISDAARTGELNTLAVEVFPSHPDDLAWTWVDWNPTPPDKNMGIFRDVYLTTSGPVTLRYPQAVTRFDLPSLETAHLTVNAEAHNATDHEVEGTLSGRIEGISFSQQVRLAPQETKQVTFTPNEFQQLNIRSPRLWWPVNLGQQNLYDLELEFETGGKVSDSQKTHFGIREVTSEVDGRNHRIFKINGKNLLIRGGGWAGDMFLRFMPERLETEMQYVRDMNLNTIRLEGKLEPDYFFDLADRYGILIMPGWCCCDHWEHWQHREDYKEGPTWDQEDYDIAARSQADQIRRLRNHPSVFVWLNGSDNPPPPRVERMYIEILQKYQWPNPYLSSATAKKTDVTGTTGVKMEGPYEWVPPAYWTEDKELGGAHGFATEISPGPAVPPVESLRKMLPKEHLWPIDDYWNFHAGGGQFKTLKVFTDALSARYGAAKSLEDYAIKSQLMTYEGQRAMFEGFGGNRYTSSGVIQWMLNNAWPSMIWHLYDYYLMPGGGYFGTKKACEPVHVQYSYDDKSVVAVNTTYEPLRNLKLTAKVYDINLVERFAKETNLDLAADSNSRAFSVPRIKDLSPTYFLKLTLQDSKGQVVSSNFYWLSTKDDALDWKKSTWYYTPTKSYADMKQLQHLKPVKLSVNGNVKRQGETEVARLSVSNPGRSLAFFIRLQIKQGREGREVLPVIWQDNYFTLMPGERRELTATYSVRDRGNAAPYLSLEGMNILKIKVPIGSGKRR